MGGGMGGMPGGGAGGGLPGLPGGGAAPMNLPPGFEKFMKK
jgi:signal recognition particle subunit SRP54